MNRYLLLIILLFSCKEITKEKEEVEHCINFEEVDLLASIIMAECSLCSEEEMYLVGSTILNRVDNPDFPNTIKQVVYEPEQYQAKSSPWFEATPKTQKVALNLLIGRGRNKDILYFYRPRDAPYRVHNKLFYHRFSIKYQL